jgi:hypothetical protein
MKTLLKLLFLLAAVSMVIGCSKQDEVCDENCSDLQLKSAENRTIVSRYGPGEVPTFYCPIICDGEIVDFLMGNGSTITMWVREKYDDGKLMRMILNLSGSVTSQSTGITYTFTEKDKIYSNEEGTIVFFTGHDNVKGEQGTHFISIMIVLDFDAGIYDLVKAMCVPNADNKDQ